MFKRTGDWEQALSQYLAERETKPHKYGTHDCALFGAGAVMAMTGVDPAAEFRGKYQSAAGATKALIKYGAGTLEATMDAKFPLIPIGFARRGDLVFYEGNVGVMWFGFALFAGQEGDFEGLVKIERAKLQKAWAVG